MNKFIVSILFSLFSLLSIAQKKLPAFGKIDMADMQLQSCAFEPDAAAMKLFDEVETEFEMYSSTGGTRLKTEHRTRIKIFNENGYKHATIRIPFLNKKNFAKIKELNAIVYNLDEAGKITTQKLSKNDFFKEKIIGDLGLINFTFPNLKPGSVVEFTYTRIENSIIQIDPWLIQDDIPTLFSSIIIITPPASIVKSKLFGTGTVKPLPISKRNSMLRYASWYQENIPSFKAEPYMTSRTDNQMRMIFFHFPVSNPLISTITSPGVIWNFLGDYMLSSASLGVQLKKQISGTEKIIDSAKQLATTAEKIHYVYKAVKNRFPSKEQQSMEIEDLSDAWKEQSASSGEINLILINLLNKLKINSHPLLVSTRDNGVVDKAFPSPGQLNGVVAVAMIDSSRYYVLDASLENQSLDCPPPTILNREALLLRPGNIEWFMINDDRPLIKQGASIICEMNKDGLLEGEATFQHYYYSKAQALDTTEKKGSNADKFFNKKMQGLKILATQKIESENDNDPLFETATFTYEPPQTNEFFFINPSFIQLQPENPFLSDKRNTDIDFGCKQEIITSLQLSFPATFKVDHLPQNMIIRAPDSSFFYKRTATSDAGSLYVTTIFQITKPLFNKEEYESIKDFFSRMYGLMKEEIVLIQKK